MYLCALWELNFWPWQCQSCFSSWVTGNTQNLGLLPVFVHKHPTVLMKLQSRLCLSIVFHTFKIGSGACKQYLASQLASAHGISAIPLASNIIDSWSQAYYVPTGALNRRYYPHEPAFKKRGIFNMAPGQTLPSWWRNRLVCCCVQQPCTCPYLQQLLPLIPAGFWLAYFHNKQQITY